MRIEILSTDLITRTSRKNQPYFQQVGWIYLIDRDGVCDPHPTKIKFMVSKDAAGQAKPYALGNYTIHPSSFRVGQYDDLEIGFLNLIHVVPHVSPDKKTTS